MNHGSLFSGIGGFDLAAEWMGWDNVFHCEWNPFGRKVLNYHFPKSISYEDITKTDFSIHRGKIDILTGGFPCQPYSTAGKRKGKEDDRHLWPEMLRAIQEIRPKWVVGENVLGIVNWNEGLVFEEVQTDLEAKGYEVQPYVLPAAGVNAPHRRDRVWFIAYSNFCDDRRTARENEGESGKERLQERDTIRKPIESSKIQRDASNTNSGRLERSEKSGRNGINVKRQSEFGDASDTDSSIEQGERIGQPKQGSINGRDSNNSRSQWETFPTQPPICGGDDGLPTELDGITFPKWRTESIKAYGNAIVPQVALQIFKAIEQYDTSRELNNNTRAYDKD